MQCPSCRSDNPDGMGHCVACGAALAIVCSRCGTQNPARFRFCGNCAHPLAGELSRVPDREAAARQSRDAERRQLTVMFCDLVGSTTLSEQLDPEDLRETLRNYQAVCAAAIRRFEGEIVQYLGDGLLVYFGYPRAHEDDGQRAVRTGLAILADMAPLSARHEQERGVRLAVRVGIHTGLAVTGEVGGGNWRETLAVGETPNVAARLQGLAEPDTVVISEATCRLVEGYFRCESRGAHTLKGLTKPMEIHRVLGETGARSRLDVAAAKGLTALVGRSRELESLREQWQAVLDGAGRVVLVRGDAGIGKSRLIQGMHADVPVWLECRCSPYHLNSALHPVTELLRDWMAIRGNDTVEEKLRKVERLAAPAALAPAEYVPLFAALLGVPLRSPYAPLDIPAPRQRQKTLEALLALLRGISAARPALLVVEDLHWADPSTQELLGHLVEHTPAGLLAVLTFRPEFMPPWTPRPHHATLSLARLDRAEVETMVDRVAGGRRLPAELMRQIVAKTDGNPLFVEELTRLLLESGALRATDDRFELAASFDPGAIPATLRGSLMARLDRLPMAKDVAQLAATVGRESPFELLQALSPLETPQLEAALNRLVEARLLEQQGVVPQATFAFRHALVQEAAYQSVLKSTRQQFHPRIARLLEERFPEIADSQPELLAYHYTAAGANERAIPYWARGGQRAMERSANLESIAHLRKGLELLATVPETPERSQQELSLQITLSMPLMATRGWAAPEVEQASARARVLCRSVGQSAGLIPALWGLWNFYIVRARLQIARELGEQLMGLARSAADPAVLLHAHYVAGDTCFWLGELSAARAHLEQDGALSEPGARRAHAIRYGLDPGVACLSHAAWTLWLLGYPEQATTRSRQALEVARELSHPPSLGWALYCAGVLHQYRGEAEDAESKAKALLALSSEQGFPHWTVLSGILRGWAVTAQRGESAEVEQMRVHVASWRAMGAELSTPYYIALYADACARVGQTEQALDALAEMLDTISTTGECWYEAELRRMQGVSMLERARCDPREAANCFRHSIEVARRQSAKSLELRASLDLCRVLQRENEHTEALQQVRDLYGWFTEGFDTRDLRQAKELIEELSVT